MYSAPKLPGAPRVLCFSFPENIAGLLRSGTVCSALWIVTAGLFLPRTAEANIAIIGSLAREHVVAPGETFAGDVMVRNTGKTLTTVRVSQADYRFTAEGSNDFPVAGTLPRSNAPWITVDNTILKLAPGETFAVHYQGQVPNQVPESGSHWSLLLVQETNGVFTAQNVQTITRYGIQIVTDVGEAGRRSIRFLKRTLEGHAPDSSVLLDLENDGERLIFPQVWLELFTASGNRIGRFESKSSRIYPECSARCRVDLSAVPRGSYQAIVYVDCGDDQITGMRCALEL